MVNMDAKTLPERMDAKNIPALVAALNEYRGRPSRWNAIITAEDVQEAIDNDGGCINSLIGHDVSVKSPLVATLQALGVTADEWTHYGSVANEELVSFYI